MNIWVHQENVVRTREIHAHWALLQGQDEDRGRTARAVHEASDELLPLDQIALQSPAYYQAVPFQAPLYIYTLLYVYIYMCHVYIYIYIRMPRPMDLDRIYKYIYMYMYIVYIYI